MRQFKRTDQTVYEDRVPTPQNEGGVGGGGRETAGRGNYGASRGPPGKQCQGAFPAKSDKALT